MDNNYSWLGKWYIKARDTKIDKTIYEKEIKNTIMDIALEELTKTLYGESSDLEIKYLAVGTSSASIQTTQTMLGAEVFRAAHATRVTSSTEVITTYVIFDTEAMVQIEELAIFGGSSATTTTDSGTMISRILWSYDKTLGNIELQFQRTDKIQRA